ADAAADAAAADADAAAAAAAAAADAAAAAAAASADAAADAAAAATARHQIVPNLNCHRQLHHLPNHPRPPAQKIAAVVAAAGIEVGCFQKVGCVLELRLEALQEVPVFLFPPSCHSTLAVSLNAANIHSI
ncbi:hypothetical protein C9890_0413, partial [Perkinsus sp. BL_2016]